MYNVFEYFNKTIRSFRCINNHDNKHIHIQVLPITSKNEPCEIDKPVPQKYIYY